MTNMLKDWEQEFDEHWEEAYCVDCLRGSWKRDHVKAFILRLLASQSQELEEKHKEDIRGLRNAVSRRTQCDCEGGAGAFTCCAYCERSQDVVAAFDAALKDLGISL